MKCKCQGCGCEYKVVERSGIYCPTCEQFFLHHTTENYIAGMEDPVEFCNRIAGFFNINPEEEDTVKFVLSLSIEEVMNIDDILFGQEYATWFHKRNSEDMSPYYFQSDDSLCDDSPF